MLNFKVGGVDQVVPVLVDGKLDVGGMPDAPKRKVRRYTYPTQRNKGVWYRNVSGKEITLYLLTPWTDNHDGNINFKLRADASSTEIYLQGNWSKDTGVTNVVTGKTIVPIGWEFSLESGGIGTRSIAAWYEIA